MNIQKITEQSVWQKFFDEAGSPSFLQSWEWGNLQKSLNYDVLRLGVYSNNNLKVVAQIIKIKSRRGSFLFIPHGPIFQFPNKSQISNLKFLISYLIDLAKREGFSFIRIAPILEDREEYRKIFQDLGFKNAPIYMHAERVWVLSLEKSEEELLSAMRKTTRYLIRKAQRDGVVIEKRTDEKAVEDFYKIYQETAKRENFIPFSKEYIKKEFEAFHKTGNALFLFGKISKDSGVANAPQNDVILASDEGARPESHHIASALILFTKSTTFYHQGASIHTKIPVTYLLQWEAIREAKKRGCQFYNFWGIHQEGRTPKSWQGLTLFKTGFGGQQIDYLPTQDYIISPKYYLTYLYEKFLAWRRGA